MPEDLSAGEVARMLQSHASLTRDMFTQVNTRLDRFSAPDVYAMQHEQVLGEIREIQAEMAADRQAREEKERREEDARRAQELRRQQDRRLVFTALVAPILLLFLQLYLTARGAGS